VIQEVATAADCSLRGSVMDMGKNSLKVQP